MRDFHFSVFGHHVDSKNQTSSTSATTFVSPSQVATSSQSSSISTATTTTTTTTLPSTLQTASQSSSIASPSAIPADHVSNRPDASLYVGIALGSLAVVALIASLLHWWLRMRGRERLRPWDGNLSESHLNWWDPARDHDASEPKPQRAHLSVMKAPSMSSINSRPTGSRRGLGLSRDPYTLGHVPTLPLRSQMSAGSVRGLNLDLGHLTVANLVSGDIISSGEESSRPTTRLGMASMAGTPRESTQGFRPRYLGLGDGGLAVPWEPPQSRDNDRWKTRLRSGDTARPTESSSSLRSCDDPLVLPSTRWTDSLRSNILNALNGFAGAPPSEASDASGVPRPSHPWSLTREKTESWMLEETHTGGGIVHIRDVDPDLSMPHLTDAHGHLPSPPPLPPLPSALSKTNPFLDRPSNHLPSLRYPNPYSSSSSASTVLSPRPSRKTYRSHRPPIISRHSSGGRSATSVGSDMTRSSTNSAARFGRLTEKEEAARRALRERRMKSVGHSIKSNSRRRERTADARLD